MKMPIVKPIPIETKGKGFFKSLWRWMTYTRKWEVVEDFYYFLKDRTKIVIPKGFIFDGASIPKLFRTLLSPTGLLFIPGLLHDYAYKYNRLEGVKVSGNRYPYKQNAGKMFWDKMFREEATRVNGMAPINWAAWSGLFIGGYFAWRGHRKKILTAP